MKFDEIIDIATLLGQAGLTDIKLTGGEPALYREIIPLISALRRIPTTQRLEVVTRHPRCGKRAADLHEAGLDVLNFSLDSLNSDTWTSITGVRGHKYLIDAIEAAAKTSIILKINMVVLRGVNDHEVPDMIAFCSKVGASLKLLDLIVDVNEFSDAQDYADRHYHDLLSIVASLEASGMRRTVTHAPGGLGHPLPTFELAGGRTIQVKSARQGAWYGDVCKSCRHFPCHDALMALRLTPNGQLQRCLLRSDNLIDLLGLLRSGATSRTIEHKIEEALGTYWTAQFSDFNEILGLRSETKPLLHL